MSYFVWNFHSNWLLIGARCYASAAYAIMWCLCVSSRSSYILSKRINISSKFFHHRVAKPFSHTKRHGNIPTGPPPPNGDVECRWVRQKSRFWESQCNSEGFTALLVRRRRIDNSRPYTWPAATAATGQVLSIRRTPATCDTYRW